MEVPYADIISHITFLIFPLSIANTFAVVENTHTHTHTGCYSDEDTHHQKILRPDPLP